MLAEDRWEDYQWEYERERYAYWGSGFSWIEDPEGDPMGVETSESWKMSTVPRPGADLAFYLVESEPLPRSVLPESGPQVLPLGAHAGTLGHKDSKLAVSVTEDRSSTTVTVEVS